MLIQSNSDILNDRIYLNLEDTQWPFEYTDHTREIVRAIVFDGEKNLYFVRTVRDDRFIKGICIETSGGGVEPGEKYNEAIKRELKEELGAETEIITEIGIVSDYYNLIHRHNLNRYYLCRAISFGEKNMLPYEKDKYHMTTLKLTYDEAVKEYKLRSETKLGKLIADRELPILYRAGELLKYV